MQKLQLNVHKEDFQTLLDVMHVLKQIKLKESFVTNLFFEPLKIEYELLKNINVEFENSFGAQVSIYIYLSILMDGVKTHKNFSFLKYLISGLR